MGAKLLYGTGQHNDDLSRATGKIVDVLRFDCADTNQAPCPRYVCFLPVDSSLLLGKTMSGVANHITIQKKSIITHVPRIFSIHSCLSSLINDSSRLRPRFSKCDR